MNHALTKLPQAVTSSKELWHGDYCCIPDCKKSSGSNKMQCKLGLQRIPFHSFPNIELAKGKLWIKMIHHDPGTKFVVNKYTKICSSLMISFSQMNCWRVEDNAVPLILPWHDADY